MAKTRPSKLPADPYDVMMAEITQMAQQDLLTRAEAVCAAARALQQEAHRVRIRAGLTRSSLARPGHRNR